MSSSGEDSFETSSYADEKEGNNASAHGNSNQIEYIAILDGYPEIPNDGLMGAALDRNELSAALDSREAELKFEASQPLGPNLHFWTNLCVSTHCKKRGESAAH